MPKTFKQNKSSSNQTKKILKNSNHQSKKPENYSQLSGELTLKKISTQKEVHAIFTKM